MKRLLRFLTLYDKILIIGIAAVSIFFIIYPVNTIIADQTNDSGQRYLVIKSDNGDRRLPMDSIPGEEPLLIKVEGPIGTSIIETHGGKVRLKEAPPDDPLKICEKTGWIEDVGPSIICIPNQISIWIESGEADVDGTTW